MRHLVITAVAIASTATTLAAGDFWKDKPASEWSDKEVQRLISRSPWAKETIVNPSSGQMRGPGMGGPGMGGPGMGPGGGGVGGPGIAGPGVGGAPGGGAGGPGMGAPGGGMGGPGMGGPESMPSMKATIRWESAAPVREAALKRESESTHAIAGWAKDFYVVSVSGMPIMGPRGREGQRQPDEERARQMQERLRSVTVLRVKGKDAMPPARVEMLPGKDGMTFAFLFPRSEPIVAADKEVSFETALGPMEIKSKFALKDMMYQGKLEM